MFTTLHKNGKKETTEQKGPVPQESDYTFTQNEKVITITINVPLGTHLTDLYLEFKEYCLRVGLLGQKPIIEGKLFNNIDTNKVSYSLVESNRVVITLEMFVSENWPVLVIGPNNYKIDPHSRFLLAKFAESEGDLSSAFRWLLQAAEEGHFQSIFRVATIYTTDTRYPVQVDNEKALKYWKIAAKTGQGESLFMVGCFYYSGTACSKDYAKSVEYFDRAIRAGCTAAYFNLGLIYIEGGWGVERDDSLALDNFIKSTKAGNVEAMVRIALMYIEGKGVKRDFQKARQFIVTANKMNPYLQIPEEIVAILNRGQEAYEEELKHADGKSALQFLQPKPKETEQEEKPEKKKVINKKKEKVRQRLLFDENRNFRWLFSFGSMAVVSGFSIFLTFKNEKKK
ncbi:sel1l adaptor subunit of erad e3 ubiquitin ligase [Anaeramoeba flamelloides]|uniref:Sel1l adaptor subunit of erad e3 ubiquitin ligase n=1 Tax=Anaeramoeba flamelloides TaxID=1746091 RepID=A0ABQ8Y1Z4_9EUKA|nr:sel1l adaptor subunit of erad e3 ubiquitin ligase [Anaeramoeba flamelloides]